MASQAYNAQRSGITRHPRQASIYMKHLWRRFTTYNKCTTRLWVNQSSQRDFHSLLSSLDSNLPADRDVHVSLGLCCTLGVKRGGDTRTYIGPWFNMKKLSYQYRKSHCGDKTILRPSYLHNAISYIGKMTFLYWIRAQIPYWSETLRNHMTMMHR